eukprot:Phypoly_transcript_02909.p1 GENE.Phypoly_transcript_02909~~Phypoly_transcript_02909.p1  ORF type:complete len:738 (+),score=92.94 Phypoly_transcript_02909:54-2267(+)
MACMWIEIALSSLLHRRMMYKLSTRLLLHKVNILVVDNAMDNCLHLAFAQKDLRVASELFRLQTMSVYPNYPLNLMELLHQKNMRDQLPIDVDGCDVDRVMSIIGQRFSVCWHYGNGYCSFGDRCKYLHFIPHKQTPSLHKSAEIPPPSAHVYDKPARMNMNTELTTSSQNSYNSKKNITTAEGVVVFIVKTVLQKSRKNEEHIDFLLAIYGAMSEIQAYLSASQVKLKAILTKYPNLFRFVPGDPHTCLLHVGAAKAFLARVSPDDLPPNFVKSPSGSSIPSNKSFEEKEEQKRRVFNRTEGKCYLCKTIDGERAALVYENYGKSGLPGAWNFEHVKPKSRNPNLDAINNLLPAHIECNSKKSYHELETIIGDDFDILTIALDVDSLHPKAREALKRFKESKKEKEIGGLLESMEIKTEEEMTPSDKSFWDLHNINVINYDHIQMERKTLGKGSYGIVKQGTWEYEKVAVKIIMDDNDIDNFKNEALSIGKNNSAHIVRMVGVCLDPHAIVLEFMPGGSLLDLLNDEVQYKQISLLSKLQYVIDIAIGIHHVHLRNMIHRDIKPANVLLTEDKKHCKLSDFGETQAKSDSGTMDVGLKGTTFYMSPEAYVGVGNYTIDTYSLGICMHQILTGQSPYENEMKQITEDKKEEFKFNSKQTPDFRRFMKTYIESQIMKKENPLRPTFPAAMVQNNPPLQDYAELAQECWNFDPHSRPTMQEVIPKLLKIRGELEKQGLK